MFSLNKNSSKKQNKNKSKDFNEEIKSDSRLNILDVDLIKGEKEEAINWGKYLAYIFLAIIASSVLSLEIYWLIGQWEKQENKRAMEVQEESRKVEVQISELEKDNNNLANIKRRIDLIDSLLNKHPHWTNFFNFIERRTLSTVFWDSFSGDLSGKYSLKGEANSFSEITWQTLVFLDSDFVKSARSSNTNIVDNSKVNFDFDFEINDIIFYR